MYRRKPTSAKHRREQLKLKRAVKRGDVSPPPPFKPDRPRKASRGPPLLLQPRSSTDPSSRLESSFVRLPPAFLDKTRELAFALSLPRPISPELAILPDIDADLPALACPKRPKWRYDMSKKEVEANEQGLFRKWLAHTDATLNAWCNPHDPDPVPSSAAEDATSGEISHTPTMPHAPTSYERNLEVWRQLWRATELSQILLILLDSRCPVLHFPPALSEYVSATSGRRFILVLTKVDISGPARAEAWTKYLHTRYPDMRVVQVESYVEKHPDGQGSSSARQHVYEPHIPTAFRQALVNALREAHAELLAQISADKTEHSKLRIKSEVDWDAVLQAHGGQVGTVVGGAAAPRPNKSALGEHTTDEHTDNDGAEPELLTIGLIGQPNVGKSSLLNALFGTQKVGASRTPGKTKHFQTLFWTPEVRLVDCPGLVIPNYVPMESQVLSGILPISRVSAVPLCIHHAAQLLPLELILDLAHPSLSAQSAEDPPPVEDKRTWRDGRRPRASGTSLEPAAPVWTAMDILTAYANKKGWTTAQAGRPDVNRAGNAILRALAEGTIRWAFWPPGTDPQTIAQADRDAAVDGSPVTDRGIWIPQAHVADDSDSDNDGEEDEDDEEDSTDAENAEAAAHASDTDSEGEDGAYEDADEAALAPSATAGRFSALLLDGDSIPEEEDDDEESK